MECPHDRDLRPDLALEYAVSRLLAGDLSAYKDARDRLLDLVRRKSASYFSRYFRIRAMQLSYLALYSPLEAPRVAEWRVDDRLALPYYRTGRLEKVPEQRCEIYEGGGVHWFCCAMACQKLGRVAQAREYYARGAHWLERRMKYDRRRRIRNHAGDFLQTEALRREAKRLIFE